MHSCTVSVAMQEKCVQYWPALMDTTWSVDEDLSVTLELQTQYAAYRVKKILLENVSPKVNNNYAEVPKGFMIEAITVHQVVL